MGFNRVFYDFFLEEIELETAFWKLGSVPSFFRGVKNNADCSHSCKDSIFHGVAFNKTQCRGNLYNCFSAENVKFYEVDTHRRLYSKYFWGGEWWGHLDAKGKEVTVSN